ncbi:MAG: hypothetical protein AAF460_15650, partial [Pseudomonadota bacterium]
MLPGYVQSHITRFVAITWLADITVPAIGFYIAHAVYLGDRSVDSNYYAALMSAVLISALYFPLVSLYRPRRGEWVLSELRNLGFAVVALFGSLMVLAVMSGTTDLYSRVWFGLWFLLTLTGLMCSRVVIRSTLSWLRSSGFNRRHVLLIGTPTLCRRAERAIRAAPWAGFHISRVFTGRSGDNAVLARWDEIAQYLQANHVDQVWVTLPLRDAETTSALSNKLSRFVVGVRYAPDQA